MSERIVVTGTGAICGAGRSPQAIVDAAYVVFSLLVYGLMLWRLPKGG